MAHMKRFERGYLRRVRQQRGGQLYAYQQKAREAEARAAEEDAAREARLEALHREKARDVASELREWDERRGAARAASDARARDAGPHHPTAERARRASTSPVAGQAGGGAESQRGASGGLERDGASLLPAVAAPRVVGERRLKMEAARAEVERKVAARREYAEKVPKPPSCPPPWPLLRCKAVYH